MEPTEETLRKEQAFFKVVANGYKILRSIYPNRELSLQTITELSGVHRSDVSRIVRTCGEIGAIDSWTEKVGRGRPRKVVSLTERMRRIIDTVTWFSSKEEDAPKRSLEKLHLMIERDDVESSRKMAAEEIYQLSVRYPLGELLEIFEEIYNKLLDEKYHNIKIDLLITLRNVINKLNTTRKEKYRRALESSLIEVIRKASPIASEDERLTVKYRRGRIEAIKTLAALYESESGYQKLLKLYLDSFSWHIALKSELRSCIIRIFPEKRMDLKMEILNLVEKGVEPDSLNEELTQLR